MIVHSQFSNDKMFFAVKGRKIEHSTHAFILPTNTPVNSNVFYLQYGIYTVYFRLAYI